MWSARYGTPIHRATEHTADVLSVCVSSDDSMIFAAGVDARVVVWQRGVATPTKIARKNEEIRAKDDTALGVVWAVVASERRHTHDIRAMACSLTNSGEV